MIKDRDAALQELLDRQEIYDCMIRYCRGVDRGDAELRGSAYHPDGVDDHGGYVGLRDGFVKWSQNIIDNFYESSLHVIGNHYCELHGDVAYTETYFIAIEKPKTGGRQMRGGRYIQQFEKRKGRWGIAESICTLDCDEPVIDAGNSTFEITPDLFVKGSKDKNDPSYARPLKVDRKRFTSNFESV